MHSVEKEYLVYIFKQQGQKIKLFDFMTGKFAKLFTSPETAHKPSHTHLNATSDDTLSRAFPLHDPKGRERHA